MEAAGLRSSVLVETDPHSEWVHGDEFDTLIVDVSGFTTDQLNIKVDPPGSLKISGQRPVNGGRQWFHFLKRFDLPGACDAAAIKGQLDKGMLYVQVPRSSGHTAAITADGEQHPAATITADGEQHPAATITADGEQHPAATITADGEQHPAATITADGEQHPAAIITADGEQHPAERYEDEDPVSLLAKSLSKHWFVVLNVLAVVLLWLVAFVKNE